MNKKSEKNTQSKETTIQIKFANEAAAYHFADWLCGSGEQQYFDWMKCREQEQEGDITVIEFDYHGKEDKTKKKNDPKRYGEFMEDNTIRTTCGRLDRNE